MKVLIEILFGNYVPVETNQQFHLKFLKASFFT